MSAKKMVEKVVPAAAQKVRWVRQQAGWNQAEAAKEIGVTRETFSRWETGAAVIPPAKLHKLKHLAHVSLADFRPALIYDKDGYPAPYTIKDYKALMDDDLTADEQDEKDKAFFLKLAALERDEFVSRQIERDILLGWAYDHLKGRELLAHLKEAKEIAMAANGAFYQSLLLLV